MCLCSVYCFPAIFSTAALQDAYIDPYAPKTLAEAALVGYRRDVLNDGPLVTTTTGMASPDDATTRTRSPSQGVGDRHLERTESETVTSRHLSSSTEV